MSAPFQGWQAEVSLQKETTFNSASAEPVYGLAGKIRLAQSAEFVSRSKTVNVWRAENTSHHAGQFFAGSLEVELGLNEIMRLLLCGFFELESQAIVEGGSAMEIFGEFGMPILGESEPILFGAGLTQYLLRPSRLQAVQSFKLGVDFASQAVLFSGVVIDQITFDVRRNQVPKMQVLFKAAARTEPSPPALAASQTVEKRLTHHTTGQITMDSGALKLTEASFTFSQRKQPARFGTDKAPTRFQVQPFFMAGQLAERFGPDSTMPAAILGQNEHTLFFQITDEAATGRLFAIYWPAVNLADALPDLSGRDDLLYRANLTGLQSIGFEESGPKLLLVI